MGRKQENVALGVANVDPGHPLTAEGIAVGQKLTWLGVAVAAEDVGPQVGDG